MQTYLGLDLGGTKLMIGEIGEQGNILKSKKYEIRYPDQRTALEVIEASLDDYIETVGWERQKPVSMGVGLMGRVNPYDGIWLQIDPSRTQEIPLAKLLSERY